MSLLIAQVDPPDLSRGGDWYYRSFQPARAMAEEADVEVISLTTLHPERERIFVAADILVLHGVCDPDLLPLFAERRAARRLTVFEISDDLSAVQPWSAVHRFYSQPENFTLLLRLAHNADALQFSVQELDQLYGYLNPHRTVFLNQLDSVPPLGARPERPFTIGWGGSHGHLADVESIAAPLIGWLQSHPTTQLAIMGSEPIWRLFDRVAPTQKRYTPPGTLEDYYAFLDGLDVGLAPLCDTPFNRSRSDVKWLEYAARGVVPILSRLTPYRMIDEGSTALLFSEPDELIRHLDAIATDDRLRARLRTTAHANVRHQRMARAHAHQRIAFYRAQLERIGHVTEAPSSTEDLMESLSRRDGARVVGRHIDLEPTDFERLLHDGLVLRQDQTQRMRAVERFSAAARLHPESHLPALYLAATGHEPASRLTAALERNPRSVAATLSLGAHHASKGEVDLALARFLAAAELCPSYDVPYRRTAALLRTAGSLAEADEFDRHAAALVKPLLPMTSR